MTPLLDIGRSMRRSHARRMVLAALAELEEARVAQIAQRALQTPARVAAILHGQLPGFRPELSLLALGLAEERRAASEGGSYAITPRGRLVIASLRRGGLKMLEGGEDAALARLSGASAGDPDVAARPAPRNACPTCGHAREE